MVSKFPQISLKRKDWSDWELSFFIFAKFQKKSGCFEDIVSYNKICRQLKICTKKIRRYSEVENIKCFLKKKIDISAFDE